MYHAALAAENERAVRVLSYAPGPLDTAMQAAVRAGPGGPVREQFERLHAEGRLGPG